MPELRYRGMPVVRSDYTPHVRIDLEGLYAADSVVINGHRFIVASADVQTRARVSGRRRDGSDDVMRDATNVRLEFVHADWGGCPVVDPDEPRPAHAEPWSVWSTQPGNRLWLWHAGVGRFLPVVTDLADALEAQAPQLASARMVSHG
jgi:hypothetical protein